MRFEHTSIAIGVLLVLITMVVSNIALRLAARPARRQDKRAFRSGDAGGCVGPAARRPGELRPPCRGRTGGAPPVID